MTEARASEWCTPHLLRDRKPLRPGSPETVTEVERNVALALLLAKLHAELYEIEMEPVSAEAVADFLTAMHSLYDLISPAWPPDEERQMGAAASLIAFYGTHEVFPLLSSDVGFALQPRELPLPAFYVAASVRTDRSCPADGRLYTSIHPLIERLGRNLLDRTCFIEIIEALARASMAHKVDEDDVVHKFTTKLTDLGGFNGHLLWQSTEF